MTDPDHNGWVPWTETESGSLKPPELGGLENGETIESRYEYDPEGRIISAWSRKMTAGWVDPVQLP